MILDIGLGYVFIVDIHVWVLCLFIGRSIVLRI